MADKIETSDAVTDVGLAGSDIEQVIDMYLAKIRQFGKDADPAVTTSYWNQVYKFALLGAELGSSDCMQWLGDICYGDKSDLIPEATDRLAETEKWWTKACECGSGRAATNLGLLHLGKPIPGCGMHGALEYDEKQAFELFNKGAENGDTKAGRHIGLCYRDGVGCERNAQKSFLWFRKAAESGDSSAALYVADCLLDGIGTEQNIPEAISRYMALVEEGGHDVTTASYALGCIYRGGVYVAADEALSRKYFEITVRTATKKEAKLAEEAKLALEKI